MSIASEIQRIKNNIAAAYSACESKGANMPQLQNSNNLADTINSISQGGISVNKKDVNFFDYDGTLLYSYTFSEAAELSALPNLPTHTGLVTQEWNWSLSKIKSKIINNMPINVGCNYDTDDGSTRLYLYVHKGTRIPTLSINLRIAAASSVIVSWGDGTTSSYTNTDSSMLEIQAVKTDYTEMQESGELCVKISGGSIQFISRAPAIRKNIFYGGDNPILTRVNIGSNCTKISDFAFLGCQNLTTVSLSNTVTDFGSDCFYHCDSLRFLAVPKSVAVLQSGMFQYCGFSYVSVSENVNSIGQYVFSYCGNLLEFVIPERVDTLQSSLFYYCGSLSALVLPAYVTLIREDALRYCDSLYVLDLSAYNDPARLPELRNTNALSNTPSYLKIYVADQTMLDAFSSATNWSDYAPKMQIKGASE